MKKFGSILMLSMLITASSAFAQFDPETVGFNAIQDTINMLAKVKMQTEILADEQGERPITHREYDKKGRLISLWFEESNNEENLYAYDAQGRLSTVTMNAPEHAAVNSFTYDANGRVLKYEITQSEPMEYIYTADSAGNTIHVQGRIYRYLSDDSGNITENQEWMDIEEYKYSWDAKHRLRSITVLTDGTFSFHADYIYNEKGLLVKTSGYTDEMFPDSPSFIYLFAYDSKDLLLNITGKEDDYVFTYKYTYTFY